MPHPIKMRHRLSNFNNHPDVAIALKLSGPTLIVPIAEALIYAVYTKGPLSGLGALKFAPENVISCGPNISRLNCCSAEYTVVKPDCCVPLTTVIVTLVASGIKGNCTATVPLNSTLICPTVAFVTSNPTTPNKESVPTRIGVVKVLAKLAF
jgi:hypothetical protein